MLHAVRNVKELDGLVGLGNSAEVDGACRLEGREIESVKSLPKQMKCRICNVVSKRGK